MRRRTKHGIMILSIGVGFAATIFATVKTTRKIDQLKEEGVDDKKELLKAIAPTVIAGASTVGLMIASQCMSEREFHKVKNNLKDLNKTYDKFKSYIPAEQKNDIQRKMNGTDCLSPYSYLDKLKDPDNNDNKELYFDHCIGEYFRLSPDEFSAALYKANKSYMNNRTLTVFDYYKYLGVELDISEPCNEFLPNDYDYPVYWNDIGWDSEFGYGFIEPRWEGDDTIEWVDTSGNSPEVWYHTISWESEPHLL